jgi:AbrB family looped-hinge helix DNA binding protein
MLRLARGSALQPRSLTHLVGDGLTRHATVAVDLWLTITRVATGIVPPMMVSIDRAGRVVIPKDVRDRLSLEPDSELELTASGDGILLTPRRVRGRIVEEQDGWPVIAASPGAMVTDADVQRWRDADQR